MSTFIHSQIILMAITLYHEILQMYLTRKQEFYGDGKEDEDMLEEFEMDMMEILRPPTSGRNNDDYNL